MKILQALMSRTSLIVLLIVSNLVWGTYYFKDRASYRQEIQMLDGAYKHILEDKSLQIKENTRIIDSLAQIPKASTDEKDKELIIKYKDKYNIIVLNDTNIRKYLRAELNKPRVLSKESSN